MPSRITSPQLDKASVSESHHQVFKERSLCCANFVCGSLKLWAGEDEWKKPQTFKDWARWEDVWSVMQWSEEQQQNKKKPKLSAYGCSKTNKKKYDHVVLLHTFLSVTFFFFSFPNLEELIYLHLRLNWPFWSLHLKLATRGSLALWCRPPNSFPRQ